MTKAGVAGGLSKLVPDHKFNMAATDKEIVAVRTGVVIADTLLAVNDLPKDKLLANMATIQAGMKAIGAGGNIDATLDDLTARISNDSIVRDELLKELDQMHQQILPEIVFNGGEKLVPLLQAGSWLEGSNLVASAILAANKPEAGTNLLRQEVAVGYFLNYVQTQASTKPVSAQLEKTLLALKDIAAKPTLTADDVQAVKDQTAQVLALL